MSALSSAGEERGTQRAPTGSACRSAERHRQVLHPVDEVRLQALDVAGHADVGEPVEQVLEHHDDLHAGQVGAQAEVGSAPAEGHMGVGFPADVESIGLLEYGLVPVGRDVEEDHLLPVLDRSAPPISTSSVVWRRKFMTGVTKRSISSTAEGSSDPVVAQALPLVGELREGHHRPRHQVAGRLVARHRQQHEEEVELELRQPLAVQLDLGRARS